MSEQYAAADHARILTHRFGKREDVRDGQGTGHVSFEALPDLRLASYAGMVLFDPAVHLTDYTDTAPVFSAPAPPAEAVPLSEPPAAVPPEFPYEEPDSKGLGSIGALPPLPLSRALKLHPNTTFIPREQDCLLLWNRYKVPGHIRGHSRRVADLAAGIARRAREGGMNVQPEAVMAAGLLHDLGKAYCILHGGNHAQVAASWVMRETRNGPIARGVLFHVHWPWQEDLDDDSLLPMALIYADKRVMHDSYVSIKDRYSDLMDRYGVTPEAVNKLHVAQSQGKRIEAILSERLGENLNEYIAYCGRLVKRT